MHFERAELHDFRAYEHSEVDFGPGLNVLVGPNASGKTSLLEALSVLATARSFRGAVDSEMVRTGRSGYRVAGRFAGRHGSHGIEVVFQQPSGSNPARKAAAVDARPLPRPSAVLGRIPLTSFSPDDLALVKGPPAERRRFLDLLVAQTGPVHRERLLRFQRTVAQRNALLADLAARRTAPAAAAAVLEPWDEALGSESASVQAARAEVVGALAAVAGEVFGRVDGRELGLCYQPSIFDPARRADEIRRGLTLTGAHHDELVVTVAGRDARRFASQGQQRSVVLALKLAAREVLERLTGETPVLLLDDVMSELDAGRGALLVGFLLSGQVFVTTTDGPGLVRALGRSETRLEASWYRVEDARVEPAPVRTGGGAPS